MRLRVRYQTIEFEDFDVHLRTLRDAQQYDADAAAAGVDAGVGDAHWSLSGVLWDAGRALAERMSTQDIRGLRILEVGCGIALPSLVLNARGADITATDHNPSAGTFLEVNTGLNEGPAIPFSAQGWDAPPGVLGRFDLIIGSDLLYEPDQAALLSAFIARHAAPAATVILVDPGRGQLPRMARRLAAHGFTNTQEVVAMGETGEVGKLATFVRTAAP